LNGITEPLLLEPSEVLGVVLLALVLIFGTEGSQNKYLKRFYRYVPALFGCYFLPGALGTAGVFGTQGRNLLFGTIGTPIILPAVITMLTASCDVPAISRLGSKALGMFFAGTAGVVVGGPVSVLIMTLLWKSTVAGDGVWRGLAYVAGGWIGGTANANAMVDIFDPPADDLAQVALTYTLHLSHYYSLRLTLPCPQAIALDAVWANVWLMLLLFIVSSSSPTGPRARLELWLGVGDEHSSDEVSNTLHTRCTPPYTAPTRTPHAHPRVLTHTHAHSRLSLGLRSA
jgi:uncharacterized membrane protein